MTYATDIATSNPVKAMSLFKGISNEELAAQLCEDRRQASRETVEALGPILLKIAKGEPVDMSDRKTSRPKRTGAISSFFARHGL